MLASQASSTPSAVAIPNCWIMSMSAPSKPRKPPAIATSVSRQGIALSATAAAIASRGARPAAR